MGGSCCPEVKTSQELAPKGPKKGRADVPVDASHPSHARQVAALNRILGQVQGIKRMIEGRRYCPEILIQTRAAVSAIKPVEMRILETHLRHCVSQVIADKNIFRSEAKVNELVSVLSRF